MHLFKRSSIVLICLLPQLSWGWGMRGHALIASIGSELTDTRTQLWSLNASTMTSLSQVPDKKWKSLPTAAREKSTHWFQADAYISSALPFGSIPRSFKDAVAAHGASFVESNGTAVWRIQQFAALSLAATKATRIEEALQMAGVMSHYVGDNSQPLHITVNYDGKLTGQTGIHKYFETDLLEQQDIRTLRDEVLRRARILLSSPAYQQIARKSLSEIVFAETERAFAQKDAVLNIDKISGRSGKGQDQMLEIATDRLADGAATLAIVLNKISEAGGFPTISGKYNVGTPDWIQPDYSGTVPFAKCDSMVRIDPFVSDFLNVSGPFAGDCEYN